MQGASTSAATQGGNAHAEPVSLLKRIGSTTYKVSIHFSRTSKETLDVKLVRLIKREAAGL